MPGSENRREGAVTSLLRARHRLAPLCAAQEGDTGQFTLSDQ